MPAFCGEDRVEGGILSSIDEALEDIRRGKMVIVVDDEVYGRLIPADIKGILAKYN